MFTTDKDLLTFSHCISA